MAIPKISKDPTHRANMIGLGLNPLNEDHVRKYLAGKGSNGVMKENIERLKSVLGNDFNRQLGSGYESEVSVKAGMTDEQLYNTRSSQPRNVRDQIKESLDTNYNLPSFNSQPSMNIPGYSNPEIEMNNTPGNKFEKFGYDTTLAYLNVFITSIKNPSIENRVQVYKYLQAVFQNEKKCQGDSRALNAYRNGCKKAEMALHQKLTNGY